MPVTICRLVRLCQQLLHLQMAAVQQNIQSLNLDVIHFSITLEIALHHKFIESYVAKILLQCD